MALYDGFFDAVQDEDTGEYDRAYSSGDFTGYYSNLIGSGVCIHDNPDSFLVRLENGAAVVSPGYLFIRGYWLKNDADYTIELPGTATYAIVAHLNLGQRLIELKADSVAQAYPDSLVLAIVSPTSAEDTRHNTDICGTIDTAGELSSKVEWAINYIDNEIESKLAAAEQTIAAQEARLDAKIAEVQAQVDRITPPPVGSIKFSASQDVGEEWLPCDGSFVGESQYPELVEALGKLIPSGDKFQLISSGEIGPQISNGVIYGGKIWVYSYSTQKLYGVDLDGEDSVKEIAISSTDAHFGNFLQPTVQNPLALSIVPHPNANGATLFLGQIIVDDGNKNEINSEYAWMNHMLLFGADFSDNVENISVSPAFNSVGNAKVFPGSTNSTEYIVPQYRKGLFVPYVVSSLENGIEKFRCAVGLEGSSTGTIYEEALALKWDSEGQNAAPVTCGGINYYGNDVIKYQRAAFGKKSKSEIVTAMVSDIYSNPAGTFSHEYSGYNNTAFSRGTFTPITVAGSNNVFLSFDLKTIPQISIVSGSAKLSNTNLSLPSSARVFVDGGAYLWGKDIYMIFVGTGIIFSRTLESGSFGYLDTTSVLGTITQFGYLDYSEDEGTLYLLGQDTTNTVKVAKIVLNTLYDYANDGAWLPMIASDGVPAYIKAYEPEAGT